MNGVKVYDNHFNVNEWTVIFALCLGISSVCLLPRRFSPKLSIIFFLCGVTTGFIFDHVLSVLPVSFYDVNDMSKLELMDFVVYWMYGPVSYLFFYLYDLLKVKVKVKFSSLYVLCTALISTCAEWGTIKTGIFHYDHGYWLGISFVIYLLVHSGWVGFYYVMRRVDTTL